MMIFFKKYIFVICLMLLINLNHLYGFGLGFNLSYGDASSVFKFSEITNDVSANQQKYGLGAVLDTRIAKEGLINYRLNVASEFVIYTFDRHQIQDGDIIYNMNDMTFLRSAIDNTLGFALIQDAQKRFWVGPSLRLVSQIGIEETPYDEYGQTTISNNSSIGYGIGAIAGLNWHTSKIISFSGEIGYRYMSFLGVRSTLEDWENTDVEIFFQLSMLFRINDFYK